MIAAVLLALGVTACAPMEQAALIYTSGFKVGVYVGTPPGKTSPEVNIGVLKDDAAYVPVAVAKICNRQGASSETCIDQLYKVHLIGGKNKVGSSTLPPIGDIQVALNAYAKSFDAWTDAQNEVVSASKGVGDQPSAAENDNARAADADLADAKAKLATAKSDVDRTRQALTDLVTGGSNSDDDKKDALSVYGTFNSVASGQANTNPTASLTLGQTFSTGIASQNLTQGLRNSATTTAVANCVTAAQAASQANAPATMSDDAKQARFDAIVALCGGSAK